MISEDAIRSRSFLIWQQEGCPDGKALEHWTYAKAQLEAEHIASLLQSGELLRTVIARPPISQRPQRAISARVSRSERYSSPSAAATQ
jgi:hypothetical protein